MTHSRLHVPLRSPKDRERDSNDASVESLKGRNVALEDENRKLRQLAEYRSGFLSRLAHELRTPLTSILGFAEILLSQEKLNEPQRNFCERIQNSAQQLQASLNQLADLSRLEAGKSELRPEEFALEDLLVESCRAVAPEARKQSCQVRSRVAANLPLIVSDRGKLRQVLYNLLAHAIASNPSGAPISMTADKAAQGFILKIASEGAALIDLESTDSRSGTSELGLAIARHNLDLLGATLSFQNRQSRGLEILIHLPTAAQNKPT